MSLRDVRRSDCGLLMKMALWASIDLPSLFTCPSHLPTAVESFSVNAGMHGQRFQNSSSFRLVDLQQRQPRDSWSDRQLDLSMVHHRFQCTKPASTSTCGLSIQGDTVNWSRVSQWPTAILDRLVPMVGACAVSQSKETRSIRTRSLNGKPLIRSVTKSLVRAHYIKGHPEILFHRLKTLRDECLKEPGESRRYQNDLSNRSLRS
jgi:hypothetical protein